MQDKLFIQPRRIGDWDWQVRVPSGPGPYPVILMVHGWTGDETAMWVFASRLPKKALLLAPRGIHPAPGGGYGWQAERAHLWPDVEDMRPAAEQVWSCLTNTFIPEADFSNLKLLGFSQGAALIYTLALLYPTCIKAFAGLAGFLPDGAPSLVNGLPFLGREVFIAHGSRDTIVPVDKARQAVEFFERTGATVNYCEDEVGHKLSATCFRSMQFFFA